MQARALLHMLHRRSLVLHGCLMPAWVTHPAMGSPCYPHRSKSGSVLKISTTLETPRTPDYGQYRLFPLLTGPVPRRGRLKPLQIPVACLLHALHDRY
jgi:hypothetical protein